MSGLCEYHVTVQTSPGPTCGSFSRLWLSLIGSEGETPPTIITHGNQRLLPGTSCSAQVPVGTPLDPVLLVRLRLEPRCGFPDVDWHCERVEVHLRDSPEDTQVFVCNRWIRTRDGDVELRVDHMILLNEETEQKLRQHRVRELQQKQKSFRWRVFVEGAPQCVDISSLSELGPNLCYSHKSSPVNIHYLKGFSDRAESWSSFSELETLFALNEQNNGVARFVKDHWREDWFFGLQTLNGPNPLMLRQLRTVPKNLAVTCNILRPFLPAGSSLQKELQKGNMYLLDYEVLEGVPANRINGKPSYLCAPLCLLHLSPQGQLLPIAIQLLQEPGRLNPVFLPSDPGCDWLLAKVWVRLADFLCHQLDSHYLRTHMMAELCCTATIRQLPGVHPLHQLLMPHVRTSLQINFQARVSLLNSGGVFDKAVGCGLEALPVMLSQCSARIRYRSLCVPDDISERGIDRLPQSLYAKDARRVWDALHRFVIGWLDLCYHRDEDVKRDSELQQWIREINEHGFPPESGFPQSFQTKDEVSEFVTVMMFSCTALHAAVNFSQLDFALWAPNSPACLLRPPPQVKGYVTEQDVLEFLPDVNTTCRVLTGLSLLSVPSVDYVPLCGYREAVFSRGAPQRLLEGVQAELRSISDDITRRNAGFALPYVYLDPERIENRVAI